MIDNLKVLILEIKEKHLEEFDALKVIQNYRYFYYYYEEMLSNWVSQIRSGNLGLLNEIENLLETELSIMKSNGERPSPKHKNPALILTIFKQKLNRLYFEIDDSKIENEDFSCKCLLRQKHQLSPSNLELLKKNGSVYCVHAGGTYSLYECQNCLAKWVHAYATEFNLSKTWMKWNPREYPLKQKFN